MTILGYLGIALKLQGREGPTAKGWFLSFHCLTKYVKVTFFRGMYLRPVPPVESKDRETRYWVP